VSEEATAAADAVRRAEDLLRRVLYRSASQKAWLAKLSWRDRDDIEFALLGGSEGPSEARLHHAASCLASLDTLVTECLRSLAAVPAERGLFPPLAERRWYFEGISFELEDPATAEAQFTQEEPKGAFEYGYILYLVDIGAGRAGKASARTW
jgi:hypothetical protein